MNLIAAVVALVALYVAARPADDNHNFGHGKAEYFSAGIGLMIFVAAGFILITSVQRFRHPNALESVGLGLAISSVTTAVNGALGKLLLRAGAAHRSVTLTTDGKHLVTDVWTSCGVIVGVILVALTGQERLDPIVAVVVGPNILLTGFRLVPQSVTSLLDAAMPAEDLARVSTVLDRMPTADPDFSDLRTRESGRHRFVWLTVLVPANWTVEQGHGLPRRRRSVDRQGSAGHRRPDSPRTAALTVTRELTEHQVGDDQRECSRRSASGAISGSLT